MSLILHYANYPAHEHRVSPNALKYSTRLESDFWIDNDHMVLSGEYVLSLQRACMSLMSLIVVLTSMFFAVAVSAVMLIADMSSECKQL